MAHKPTYTAEQLHKRNTSKWTLVQAVLAPIQLVAFIFSVVLVLHYLITGEGYLVATISVLVKISLLWLITITGMIWEKEVFGQWFMAPEFFWEDFMNAVALIAHNLYFLARLQGWSERSLMLLMLAAYSTYLINLAQFALKGIRARHERVVVNSAV